MTCIYCAVPGSSEDGDHVVCRKFFLKRHRGELPKVPACKVCNGRKADLEHYLTTVMPFAGRHADAAEALQTLAPDRLRGNLKLARELAAGIEYSPCLDAAVLPFEPQKLCDLYEMMTRGLAWYHWALLLPPDMVTVYGWLPSPTGTAIFDQIFTPNARRRVTRQLGQAFLYDGAQAMDHEEFTVWRMSLYGAVMGDDPAATAQIGYVLTAPKTMAAANKFISLLERVRESEAD